MTEFDGDITNDICDIKRLCPELTLTRKCPECGEAVEYDFSENYISYGELDKINFYCYDGCDHDWDVKVKIVEAVLTIEVEDEH